MLHRLFVFLISFFLISCNSDFNQAYVYIEGEVLNPVKRSILFSGDYLNEEKVFLDQNNHFSVKLKVGNKFDIYRFQHGAEWQYIYVKPNDTLKFSLNTESFDESISFQGKSKAENDLLKNAYLDNQAQDKYFYNLYKLPFTDFVKKYDSVMVLKRREFEQVKAYNSGMSKDYFKVLEVNLLYYFYLRMEEYSIVNCRAKSEKIGFDMDRFLLNRRNFNLSDQSLIFYEPYFRVVKYIADSNSILKGYDFLTDNFTSSCLQNVNFVVKDSAYRQKMLSTIVFDFLSRKSSDVGSYSTEKTFLLYNTSNYDKRVLENFISDMSKAKKGSEMLDFKVLDATNTELSIKELIKGKKVFLLFHNDEYLPKDYLTRFVKEIRLKYPKLSVLIVGVNEDSAKFNSDPILRDCYYSIKGKDKRLDINKSLCTRVLLLDSNGIVFTDFMTVFSKGLLGQVDKMYKK